MHYGSPFDVSFDRVDVPKSKQHKNELSLNSFWLAIVSAHQEAGIMKICGF
jgi:hypothetical protein